MSECHVVVNGEPRAIDAGLPIRTLVAQLTSVTTGVAVALNGTVVPHSRWDDEGVRDGDRIEIVTAVQGG
jgi:sulfur carrier protein